MSNFKNNCKKIYFSNEESSERGASLVVALLILLLLMGFATLVISRVSTETIITTNDSSENRAFAATMAQLESTTRDFADVFERKLSPTTADINYVQSLKIDSLTTGFNYYDFNPVITQIGTSQATEITGGTYSGLFALRDEYQVDITTTHQVDGVQTQLRRRFFNDRIPLFQFGIFFEDDLELNRPPLFTFGGRVHTNQNFFISASPAGIYFRSKATAVGEIVNDIWKTKQTLYPGYDDQGNVFIADAGGTFRELETGFASVNCTSPSGPNVFAANPNLPVCSKRSAWDSDKAIFQGNLDTNVPRLDLPLYRLNIDLIELVRRGKNVGDMENNGGTIQAVTTASQDSSLVSRERFANKEGLRITLADSQARLPGCASTPSGLDDCGVRLDRPIPATTSIGYVPPAMTDGYQATAFNATRVAQTGKEVWIKVELVNYDYVNDRPITSDVTADILSLGLTQRPAIDDAGSQQFHIQNYSAANENNINDPLNDDIRSIIKLQRFSVPGVTIDEPTGDNFITSVNPNGDVENIVIRHRNNTGNTTCTIGTDCTADNTFAAPLPGPSSNAAAEDDFHIKWTRIRTGSSPFNTDDFKFGIVPFPIQVYDTREGVPDDRSSYTDTVPDDNVTRMGVMSLIDIDVANLRRFLEGDFNGLFPINTPYAIANLGVPLNSAQVPQNQGWLLYASDRRGDVDFDGEFDMEDVFPDSILQFNEDLNNNGTLETSFGTEAPNYTDYVAKGVAATSDHGYYRRGVRLINGVTLPGIYDSTNPELTRGFSVASENGVYVSGNYNVSSVTLTGTNAPAPSVNYLPQDTTLHIPAAIASDAVTILSNGWQDSRSFQFPYAQESRLATATQVRFAMLTGDGITGNTDIAYNPSGFGQLNGGIHNFKRFLERWSGVRLNYTGSLVNLFNSRNNNGFWKCCQAVYNPPIRDWTFDTTFLNPTRLPPGTPFIYSLSFTGFQRVNN